jgi:hypothetical protein
MSPAWSISDPGRQTNQASRPSEILHARVEVGIEVEDEAPIAGADAACDRRPDLRLDSLKARADDFGPSRG